VASFKHNLDRSEVQPSLGDSIRSLGDDTKALVLRTLPGYIFFDRAVAYNSLDELSVKTATASLTAETRQQILRVHGFGKYLEFVALDARAVQKIGGSGLARK
jgi:hypothetical protein